MRGAPPFGMMLCAIEECDTPLILEEGLSEDVIFVADRKTASPSC